MPTEDDAPVSTEPSTPYAAGGLVGGTVSVFLAVGERVWSPDGTVHAVTAEGRLERRPDEEPNALARPGIRVSVDGQPLPSLGTPGARS